MYGYQLFIILLVKSVIAKVLAIGVPLIKLKMAARKRKKAGDDESDEDAAPWYEYEAALPNAGDAGVPLPLPLRRPSCPVNVDVVSFPGPSRCSAFWAAPIV